MNTIIVGAGKVGQTLAAQLARENYNVTVIDTDSVVLDRLVNTYDILGVEGNGANLDIQREAGVANADLLIATTDSDEINMIACLVAKKLGAARTIARVRNPEYEKQLRFMRRELGLTMAINPEKEAAREIARVLRLMGASKVEAFSKGRIELIEHHLHEDSPLCGVKLMDLNKKFRVQVLICAVLRQGQVTIPSGNFTLQAEDTVYLTAPAQTLEKFFRAIGMRHSRARSVIVVGASTTGYYLAQSLADAGMSIKVLDQNEERCRYFSEIVPRALVIHGDGTDSELLAEEGIAEVDAFVALTDIDETNILMSMNVSHDNDCKVVTKVNRQSLRKLLDQTGLLDTVVSPAEVTAERILVYVRALHNADGLPAKTLHHLISGQVDALEFTVTESFPELGTPLKDLPTKEGVLLAAIVRPSGEIIIPSGSDALQNGDDVILVTTDTELTDLRDILR